MEDIISLNFGAIRDSVLKLTAAELIKENKSSTLEKFTETLHKSPILKKQQLIYKNLQESKPFQKERLAERFIAQNLQLFINENWENILYENRLLRKNLLEDMHVQAKSDQNLCEDINILIEATSNKNFTNFEKEQMAYENILSHLTRTVVSENLNSVETDDAPDMIKNAWKYITEVAVSNFDERYQHLSENEKKVFKVLVSDINTKKDFFINLKNENLNIISQKLISEKDNDTIEVLNSFKKKIETLNESEEKKLDEYILSCFELQDSLS